MAARRTSTLRRDGLSIDEPCLAFLGCRGMGGDAGELVLRLSADSVDGVNYSSLNGALLVERSACCILGYSCFPIFLILIHVSSLVGIFLVFNIRAPELSNKR